MCLSSSEFSLVRFIFDRTAGWGKEWERISIKHFIEGIESKDGSRWGGTCIKSKRTVIPILQGLLDKGAIQRERYGASFKYSLNYNWEPMKVPKRLKNLEKGEEGGKNCPSRGGKNCTPRGAKIAHIRGKKDKSLSGKESNPPPALADEKEDIEKGLEEVKARSSSRRAKQKEDGYHCRGKAGGFVPKERAMQKIWMDLHSEHFPDESCAAFSKRGLHMIRSYCKEWNVRNTKHEFISDFLPFLFERWSLIRATSLSWMSDSPECPQVMFVANAKLRSHMESGWAERESLAHLSKLSPYDREVAVLMKKGMDKEKAQQMAKELKQGGDMLKKVRREQKVLDDQKQMMKRQSIKRRPPTITKGKRPSEDDTSDKTLPNTFDSWQD